MGELKKLTLEDIEAQVDREEYHVFDDKLTVCVMTAKNGFKITGEASCVFLEDFNQEIGRKVSRGKAIAKLWEFEAYSLQTKVASNGRRL